MIIRIEYNKNTKEITLTKDDDIIVEINESDTIDNDNELKIELSHDQAVLLVTLVVTVATLIRGQ